MKIALTDCPPELREQLRTDTEKFLRWNGSCELISVVNFESTPYKDKSRIMRCYEAIVLVGNTYFVYRQNLDGGVFEHKVEVASLTIGTVNNILDNSPEWTGLPKASA